MNDGLVIGVLSGCGGAGASTFAAVVASTLALSGRSRSGAGVLLVDCDPCGGGIDVLLGCEQVPGPRWNQVRLSGGALPASMLREDLPRWGAVSFLAADTADVIDADAAVQVVAAAVTEGSVVLDLPRWACPVRQVAISLCDLVVILTPAEVRSVTSAAMVAAALDPARSVVAVRGASRSLSATKVSAVVGLDLIGVLPFDPAGLDPSGLDMRRTRKGTRRVADAVVRRASRMLAPA